MNSFQMLLLIILSTFLLQQVSGQDFWMNECPSGFTEFTRSNWTNAQNYTRYVCLQYFPITTTLNTDLICAKRYQGSMVAGIELDSERTWLMAQARADFTARGISSGGVFVGAEQSPHCNHNCSYRSYFMWTDGFSLGNDQLVMDNWLPGNPDSQTNVIKSGEHCLEMLASTADSKRTDVHGRWNDISCTIKSSLSIFNNPLLPVNPWQPRGVLCGFRRHNLS